MSIAPAGASLPVVGWVDLLRACRSLATGARAGQVLLGLSLRVGQLSIEVLALQGPVGGAEEPEQVDLRASRPIILAAGRRSVVERRAVGRIHLGRAGGCLLEKALRLGQRAARR